MTAGPVPLGPPWSDDVARAAHAAGRFEQAVGAVAPGPLQDRLATLRSQLAQVVDEVGAIAAEGQRRSGALAGLGPDRVATELKDAQRAAAEAPDGTPLAEAAEARVAAARTQHDVVHRLWDGVEATQAQIAAALTRLDGVVARAVELSVLGPGAGQPGDADRRLDEVATELEALRAAFAEIDAAAPDRGGDPT